MTDDPMQLLTTGAQRLVLAVRQQQQSSGMEVLGLNHWILTVLERHSPMAEGLVPEAEVEALRQKAQTQLKDRDGGPSMTEAFVAAGAVEHARARGKLQASERDILVVILLAAGLTLAEGGAGGSGTAAVNMEKVPGEAQKPTPTLDQFGRDVTALARGGKLSTVVGRDLEVQLMLETLCRRTKRNPVLIGQAGVGKTAIVEGLAQRVVAGQVPDLLKGIRIIGLQPSTLVAGASISGELEKRMQAILQEAAQEGIVLFIDEIHSIIGAGGMPGSSDIASILKPTLARGEIACIAATTDDEYRRFIEADAALERRFQPIRVQELSPENTLLALKALSVDLQRAYGVSVDDNVLQWLIDFGQQYMRNRHFPDKAVDLLEQCIAHAVAVGKKTLEFADAEEVAQRMIGMPLALEDRLDNLDKMLAGMGLMSENERGILIGRLQVTMRGLDMRAGRPNAVLLLSGVAAQSSAAICEVLAEALFGAKDRVVSIDCARFVHAEDINLLVGAPPGYVGYSDSLPIHRIAQIPWSVLDLENMDSCHPAVREVLSRAIQDGKITDGRGKPIYLSDTVVVITADIVLEQAHRALGFRPEVTEVTGEDVFQAVSTVIGDELASEVNLFIAGARATEGVSEGWLHEHMLNDLNNRYIKQGLALEWDASILTWLQKLQADGLNQRDWEHLVDEILSPAIIPHLPREKGHGNKKVVVKFQDDQISVSDRE